MLTNLRDAFVGQSMSVNIVLFHMLHILSYCAIVTIRLQKCRDLESRVRVHSRTLKVLPFGKSCMVSY